VPARPAAPPTLAKLPAADQSEVTDGGEFAHLDRLNGEAYEEALMKMSDDKRNEYLQSR
jgi:hypothetical protein